MERYPPGREDDPRKLRTVGRSDDPGRFDPDYVFWRQFAGATTPKEFCQSWLPLQCRQLKGVRCAMVLLGEPDSGPYTPVAVWPDAKLSMHHLTGAAQNALKERRGLLLETDLQPTPENPSPESYHIAYPIEVSGVLHGVVVLGVDERDRKEVQTIMRQLHWGAAWLEVLIRRSEAVQSARTTERLQKLFDLVASAVEHERFREAAMAFVTQMATRLECDRVSMGFKKRNHVRVDVLSHSAEFGTQTNLVRAIEAAMEEAIDQNAVIVFPLPEDADPVVTRAHADLARQFDSGAICTLPLEAGEKYFGGLMLERPAERPFDPETVELCESLAMLVGPILNNRRVEERWLIRKALDACARQLKRFFGPRYLLRKLIVLLLVGLTVFFALFKVDYRVSAPTFIEGEVQRVVAAPFDGYVRQAPARPGDVVQADEMLCVLDDRELKLERLKWVTEKEQQLKEYHAAMAEHDRSQIRILRAKIDQADAQLALIDEQLARTQVVAPFNGVVMSGDLTQSLGAPVERGQILYEIAPLGDYRIVVEVDERDINEIRVGQQSELVLPSMADEVFAFVVEKVTPVSTAREGRNYFRVEGRMLQDTARLRPGMEGIGKITIDRRKLIWVWTHAAIDWVRMQVWRWWP
ncbi:MAG: HlyD family efflux transporter periplasmic adaptor subunit [Desulfobacterales bacterium]|nr:MAG: HlyD family efflux transporter periplasmic adaptor subunit [Desulfobacterales bacterium]